MFKNLLKWRVRFVVDERQNESKEGKSGEAYMTVADVASLLMVHPETVRRLTRERMLTAHAVGRKLRYRRSEIEADVRTWGQHRQAYYRRAKM